MQEPEPIRRTREIEDATNLYVVHPIANRLTPLLRDLHVPANAVSIAGMVFGMLAGVAYYHSHDLLSACIGFILMITWHVMDGVDGQLARLTQSQSELGKVLDGLCDYVTFTAVYAALALQSSPRYGASVWLLAAIAGLFHAVQSAAYEVQRQEYEFWGWGRASKNFLGATRASGDGASPAKRISHQLDRLYSGVQRLVVGFTVAFHRRLETSLGSQNRHIEAIRRHYRETFAVPVRRWSVLSANYRTLGIFICTSLRIPLFYFLFEIVGFSLILALLTYWQRARYASFITYLDEIETR